MLQSEREKGLERVLVVDLRDAVIGPAEKARLSEVDSSSSTRIVFGRGAADERPEL